MRMIQRMLMRFVPPFACCCRPARTDIRLETTSNREPRIRDARAGDELSPHVHQPAAHPQRAARIAAEGEWRTNVGLGARSVPALPSADARELALAATRVIGIDFGGVDLLPDGDAWAILEVNGAVDVRRHYSLGPNVFSAALGALQRTPLESALLA